MMLPDRNDRKKLIGFALDKIAICRVSQGQRAAAYRSYGQWIETGRATGGLALANLLGEHLKRKAAHLFSPTDLVFCIDFENHYGDDILMQAEMAARVVTREYERKNIDTCFGEGVKEALKYGACIQKLLIHASRNEAGEVSNVNYNSRLVMPWNFGVDNEGVNDLGDQEAMCETTYLTKYEAWRRVAHLPDAENLYKRIISNSSKNEGVGIPTSFMHQVLSTAILDTSLQNSTQPMPGGIVQLSNDPNYSVLGPQIAEDLIPMHELWVKDDAMDDYTTIQIIEPDILIAPRLAFRNLFCPDTIPYTLIQPNGLAGYFWGRSEIVDLLMLQSLMTTTLDDTKRLFGQQFDKLLAFPGYDGLTDELYGQFRSQGYVGMPQGSSVTDLTPKLPEATLQYINLIEQLFDRVAGFPNVLAGKGESGVRAGSHADTLMRTASPLLRNESLLVERQCASSGDKMLSAMQAKDGKAYWTDSKDGEDKDFLLASLPDDRRVAVDSHSSSPVYFDDHQQLIGFGLKAEIVDGEYALDHLPFPDRDRAKQSLKKRQEEKAKLIQEHPELLTQGAGGKKAK